MVIFALLHLTFFSKVHLFTSKLSWVIFLVLPNRKANRREVLVKELKIYHATSVYNRWQNYCWDIILKYGNFREQKNPHPSHVPSIQSWGFCCFIKVAQTVAQHCMEGMGGGALFFPLLKSEKCQNSPSGWSVSTHFVRDCNYSWLHY